MRLQHWLITAFIALTLLAIAVPAPLAKPPFPLGPPAEDDFDDDDRDAPLPPGLSERVFIHVPRTKEPGHLGTCTPTSNDVINTYELAGWRLPNDGITWVLNPSRVPATVDLATAIGALEAAFATWTDADPHKQFFFGGYTTVTRPRLDFVNAVLWGKVSAGAIAVTYIRYYTATGIVADVDTVFNSRYPWAVFDTSSGECQSSSDAYDVQDIAIHEFGHWLGLDDLYSISAKDLTMYGYGAGGELKKRTLGVGDDSGANAVAP
ncbi:MAG: hypothetical protein ACRDHF_07710 [Tepidiformaceae bacterium]